jgi:hypothetical protein
MGLSIVAFTNATFVKKNIESEADYELTYLFNNRECSRTVEKEGGYRCASSQHVWSAPYSFYNKMRRELAELIGSSTDEIWAEPNAEIPFVELINNSDCEGGYDTNTCKALASDFRQFFEKAEATNDQDFIHFYKSVAEGFELAAQTNGCITFR